MTILKHLLGGAAVAALVGGTALAQTQTQDSGDQAASPSTDQSGEAEGIGASGQDRLIATVNDAEIREADVTEALESLPPQARQAPSQMLLPMVVEQLLLRELILAEAEADNLRDDPEVVALVETQSGDVEDQAILSIWLQRALAERVNDQAVSDAYDSFKSANPDSEVTMEEARPQIEQALTQEAMQAIATDLRSDATIVFYDASGNPMEEGAGASGSAPAPSSDTPASDAPAEGGEAAPKN